MLTHCDWNGGALADPSGMVVAAGQAADLLYVQHIVVLQVPLRHGRFIALAGAGRADTPPGEAHTVRRHRRIHADLYVFAQPQDPHLRPAQPLAPPAAA